MIDTSNITCRPSTQALLNLIHGGHPQTWERLRRLKNWLEKDETFLFMYGDGIADVNIQALMKFHHSHGKLATVISV
jgi:glucose-1-phosphate cytidylyltransferase